MMLRSFLVLYILFIVRFVFCSNSLSNGLSALFGDISYGIRLIDVYLSFDPPYTLHDCAMECLYRPRCKSFNYSYKMKFCELNYQDRLHGRLDPSQTLRNAFLQSDINTWKKLISQNCANKTCAENMKCNATSGECYYSDCGPSLHIPNMTTPIIANNAVGLTTVYRCNDDLEMVDGHGDAVRSGELVILCNAKAKWELTNVTYTCKPKVISVRLANGHLPRSGRVEIQYNGYWGQLMDEEWTNKDASVVCRSLGYSVGIASDSLRSGSGVTLSNNVTCGGEETRIDECQRDIWALSFGDLSNGAVVFCDPVRLSGSITKPMGRVELYRDDQWVSICDDHWSRNNSDVVCGSLGYGYAVGEVYFPDKGDTGQIDGMECKGTEKVLYECKPRTLEKPGCSFVKFVGVICHHISIACDKDWTYYQGSCYYISATKKNWLESAEHCSYERAHLAQILDEDEYSFLINQIQVAGGLTVLWLGGNDRFQEGHWTWVEDNSDILYNKWAPREPSGNTSQNCMAIWKDGLWHDLSCKGAKRFICKKKENCGHFHDCQDVQTCLNVTAVYTIHPGKSDRGYATYCDMDMPDGPWMTIMKKNITSDFSKEWIDYKQGFGDALSPSYWIGNEALFEITNAKFQTYQLKILAQAADTNMKTFLYNNVSTGEETNGYPLNFIIPAVECKFTILGEEYVGQKNTSKDGCDCQAWKSQTPNSHKYSDRFKDQENYCRNPDKSPNGPWCYCINNHRRWEYCDVPLCDDFFFLSSNNKTFSTKEKGHVNICAENNKFGWWYDAHCNTSPGTLDFHTITMMIKRL